MKRYSDFGALSLTAVIVLGSYLLAGELLDFAEGKAPIVAELVSAALGSVITVAALAALLRIQTRQEMKREFSARLFDRKLDIYQKLIEAIFSADDDNVISKDEVQDIENKVGVACLVAGDVMVSTCAQSLYQLKTYGVLYFRSMDDEQIANFEEFVQNEKRKPSAAASVLSNHKFSLKIPVRGNSDKYFVALDDLVQVMRSDLAVVDGDVKREIEHFVRLPYDSHTLIRNPNRVDEEPGSRVSPASVPA
jgi:hypothetical protein